MPDRPVGTEGRPRTSREPQPMVEPLWERQKGESHEAFDAWIAYRDSEKRSQRATAAKLGKSSTLLSRWASRWSWEERDRAWDNRMQEEVVTLVLTDREKHVSEARGALEKMARMGDALGTRAYNTLLQQFTVDASTGRITTTLSNTEVLRLLELSTQLWRRSIGAPDRWEGVLGIMDNRPRQEVEERAEPLDAEAAWHILEAQRIMQTGREGHG